MTATPALTISIGLDDLLAMTVAVDWDYERKITMAEAVAREIADRLLADPVLRDPLAEEVQQQVARLVHSRLDDPPQAGDSLSSMIMAEARRQLTPNPGGYHGTATPMAQYVAAEVYEAIRQPAMEIVGQVRREADKAVGRAVREQLADLLRRDQG